MITSITLAALGVLICILGIINMTGNISSLHRYHRHRVAAEDVKPFGKRVGLGTLLCGVGVLIYSGMLFVFEKTAHELFVLIGVFGMITALAVGIGISLYAIRKYNKGIFLRAFISCGDVAVARFNGRHKLVDIKITVGAVKRKRHFLAFCILEYERVRGICYTA
jgi:hypothetical protein